MQFQLFNLKKLKKRFKKKYIIVTGATGGLGNQLIKDLSSQYRVIAIGRDQNKLCNLIEKYNVITFQYDFNTCSTLTDDFNTFMAQNNIQMKDVAFVIIAHGSGIMKPLYEFTDHELQFYMNGNLISYLQLAKYCISHFSEMGKVEINQIKQRIIFVGSCLAYTHNKNYDLYCLSKGGLLNFAYMQKCIQIVNPPTIIGTGFFKGMPERKGIRKLGNLRIFSTTTNMLSRKIQFQLYKGLKVNNVGIVSKAASFVNMIVTQKRMLFN